MIKVRLNLRNVAMIACLAGVTMFFGCDKGNDPPAILVADNNTLTQEVFADNEQGKSGVSFTTTGAWTSSISTVTANVQSVQMKASANSPNWISISPESGGAGTHTIAITLETNTTGADRTAVITISCNGTDIKITVTQKGTTQGGGVPEPVNVRLVKQLDLDGDVFKFEYDAQNRITKIIDNGYNTNYSYPTANTIVFHGEGGNATFPLNSDGSLSSFGFDEDVTFTYANGYLQNMLLVGATDFAEGKPNVTYTNSITYTWENGNVTRISIDRIYDGNPQENSTETYICEYGTLPNKAISIDFVHSFLKVEDIGLIPYGWFGKSTKNLPTKVTVKQSGEPNIVITYRYETDSEGYVTKIHSRYNSETERLMASVQYK